MAKNKVIDLALLAVVFAVSFAAGYFLCEYVIPEKEAVDKGGSYPINIEQPIIEERDNNDIFEPIVLKEAPLDEPEVQDELEYAEEEPELIIYELFSSSQMEALINSGDYEQRPTNSKLIFQAAFNNIVVHNLREGDKHPDDVAELCAKIGDGVWLRVTGTVVKTNEQNIITRIETNAVYPEE